jgi:DNA-binding transcriptional ArsR family regulator
LATAKGEAGREKATSPLKLLKALAHPIRLHLLGVLSYREVSPAEFARERDEPVPNVSYHFRVLKDLGCIEVARTTPARGSQEHFYRRTEAVVFDDDHWLQLPEEARRIIASTTVKDLFGRMTEAIRAGTFTAREGTHITWKSTPLDAQGWTESIEILASAYKELEQAEIRAEERLAGTEEQGLMATLALAGFESPSEQPPG